MGEQDRIDARDGDRDREDAERIAEDHFGSWAAPPEPTAEECAATRAQLAAEADRRAEEADHGNYRHVPIWHYGED